MCCGDLKSGVADEEVCLGKPPTGTWIARVVPNGFNGWSITPPKTESRRPPDYGGSLRVLTICYYVFITQIIEAQIFPPAFLVAKHWNEAYLRHVGYLHDACLEDTKQFRGGLVTK